MHNKHSQLDLDDGATADDFMILNDHSKLDVAVDGWATKRKIVPPSAEVVLTGIQRKIEKDLFERLQEPPQSGEHREG